MASGFVRWLCGSASLIAAGAAMTLAAPAHAQEASDSEEIIVTATGREASLQEVPLAVTAISPQELERAGTNDLMDLPALSPSLSLHYSQTESQGTTLRLRGIGTTGNNIGLESAVGVFLDGVYLSRPSVALADLMDLERIEVLRGPQGTLFGRNTSAGAITITTQRPDLTDVEWFANAGYGNFNAYNLQGGVSGPIVEGSLGYRLSVAVRGQDAFLESTTGAESHTRDRHLVRGQLLWEPTEDIDFRLIGDFSETDEKCCDAPILLDPLNGSGVFDAAGLPSNGGVSAFGLDAYEDRRSNADQFENSAEQWGVSGELRWRTPIGNLTYLSGYRHFYAPTVQDVDFVSLDVVSGPGPSTGREAFDEINTFTNEIRLQGVNGRLDWLIGAYASHEEIEEIQAYEAGSDYSRYITASAWYGLFFAPGGVYSSLPAGDQATLNATVLPAGTTPTFGAITAAAAAPPQDPARLFAGGASSTGFYGVNQFQQEGDAWAVFTHNTLTLTDALELTVGLRYTSETKDGSYDQIATGNTTSCLNAQANAAAVAGQAWSNPAVAGLMQQISVGLGQLACFPFFAPVDITNPLLPQEFSSTFKDEELVYTAALRYAFGEDVSAYASITHGFKSGGFNLDSTAASLGGDPRFASEIVDSYEVGIKTDVFDGRLRANLAIFSMELEDFQVLDFNGVQFRTFNVPRVISDGAELELTARPNDAFTWNGAATYADTRYPDDCAEGLSPAPAAVTTLCGSRLMNAPLWTVVTGATIEAPINGQLRGFVNGSMRYESGRRTGTRAVEVSDLSLLPFDVQEENFKVNFRIGITSLDEHWSAELWANNVFDEQTRVVTFNIPLRGLGLAHTASRGAFIEDPRTFGITLRANY